MNEEKKKNDLKDIKATFLGKTLEKNGIKNGKEWKKFKLTFINPEGKKMTFGAFDSLSTKGLQLKDLEEEKQYKVIYSEDDYQIPGGDLIKLKTAKIIYSTETKPYTGNNVNGTSDNPYATKEERLAVVEEKIEAPQEIDDFDQSAWKSFITTEKRHTKYNWLDYYTQICGGNLTPKEEAKGLKIFEKMMENKK